MDIKDVIISILTDKKISTQAELVEELKKMNLSIEQSTISRQFKKLGVFKAIENNKIYYKIPQNNNAYTSIKRFVRSVNHNEYLIVIHTTSGAANVVGDYIDNLDIPTILGSIAGDDTIFVTPTSKNYTLQTYNTILEALS